MKTPPGVQYFPILPPVSPLEDDDGETVFGVEYRAALRDLHTGLALAAFWHRARMRRPVIASTLSFRKTYFKHPTATKRNAVGYYGAAGVTKTRTY